MLNQMLLQNKSQLSFKTIKSLIMSTQLIFSTYLLDNISTGMYIFMLQKIKIIYTELIMLVHQNYIFLSHTHTLHSNYKLKIFHALSISFRDTESILYERPREVVSGGLTMHNR